MRPRVLPEELFCSVTGFSALFPLLLACLHCMAVHALSGKFRFQGLKGSILVDSYRNICRYCHLQHVQTRADHT
ncbi:hypothetical protein DL95DRAFT_391174, partial [Leptodontidium sp. 2 PMI_412]